MPRNLSAVWTVLICQAYSDSSKLTDLSEQSVFIGNGMDLDFCTNLKLCYKFATENKKTCGQTMTRPGESGLDTWQSQ